MCVCAAESRQVPELFTGKGTSIHFSFKEEGGELLVKHAGRLASPLLRGAYRKGS